MLSDLEVLFSSAARVELLRLFLLNPGRRFYQREIERETGQPLRAVQREVERLEGIELLVRSKEGNRVFYGLNAAFPLLPQLAALLRAAVGVPGPSLPAGTMYASGKAGDSELPFSWMEAPAPRPLPDELRRLQIEGEWDRAL